MTTLGGRIYAIGGRLAGADTNLALLESFVPGAEVAAPAAGPVATRRHRGGRTRTLAHLRGRRNADGHDPHGLPLDVRKRRWSRLPNLPTPRHGLGVVAFGGKVYVLAGGTTPGLAVSSANESLAIR